MAKSMAVGLVLTLACAASQADNCEPIREQIEARYKAGGIPTVSLGIVDAGAAVSGKVVGTCGNGAKKIVLLAGTAGTAGTASAAAPASAAVPGAAAPSKAPPILTECKDGSVSTSGSCKK